MTRSRRRLMRQAVVLPPLIFIALYGYWRFACSDAFRVLLERVLASASRVRVTIGSHEIASPARIALRDLSIELLDGGVPAGVRLRAKEAHARAGRLLGVGLIEEVVLVGAEAELDGPASRLARLDFGGGGQRRIRRFDLRDLTVSYSTGGRRYRVGGINSTVDLARGETRIDVDVVLDAIEGVEKASALLKNESPRIELGVELHGEGREERRLAVRKLFVDTRTGWRLGGEMELDLGRRPIELSGGLDLWNLPLNRLLPPAESLEISAGAHAERRIEFAGPIDELRVEVTTNVKSLDLVESKLRLEAKGVTLSKLKRVKHYDLVEMLGNLAGE